MDSFVEAMKQERQLSLAILVLTGVLTREQLNNLLTSDTKPADTWEGIVAQIEQFRENQS